VAVDSAAASGWAGWALAHPEFQSSINPITTRGADYANHITASPPGFENPAESLVEASWCYFFDKWLMKLKCPNLLKPLGTLIQENYWSFYPSEPFRIPIFNMRHPVWSQHSQAKQLNVVHNRDLVVNIYCVHRSKPPYSQGGRVDYAHHIGFSQPRVLTLRRPCNLAKQDVQLWMRPSLNWAANLVKKKVWRFLDLQKGITNKCIHKYFLVDLNVILTFSKFK
jgi:hypothetical protein